ncbi:hypothetical protein A2858_02930 [Candidatus Daviesbacteria bacterium RIFCSPHIGHO2_01_FULL_36_37]|nr:MAG: hypothetical protein A2858_02930 [Candidatus Daviesbacteria bacterium RIFCSPHIGHO2_01_FULL_36_37]OGE31193.1 MAG: hypothetical protein A3C99_00905 [Candidatus Daviesbacteria bacterium RIFCSPHIGHO2_02_FULL_37_9]OGE35822.1 MAG: hypothetical protein A3E66_00815 [Candidatus Daviesbacteria bacterium RIFCSPHIGHO2_12_FULL_37_16]
MPLELNLPHPNPESLRQGAHVAGGVMVVLGYVIFEGLEHIESGMNKLWETRNSSRRTTPQITPENYTPRVLRIKNL